MGIIDGPLLITGSTGFIGEHLIKRLNEMGIDYDIIYHSKPCDLANKKSKQYKADITDTLSTKKIPGGYTKIVHLAGKTGAGFVKNPLEYFEINAKGTLGVLEFARQKGIDGIIYASSAAVYGETPRKKVTEGVRPKPNNAYSISKYAGELYSQVYRDTYGMDNITLRFFNLYGPPISPENLKGLISVFCRNALMGRPIKILEKKSNTRDYVHVKDVVQGILCSLKVKKAKHPTLNIGTGVGYSTEELAKGVLKLCGKNEEGIKYEVVDDSDVFLVASIDKAKKSLGYAPQYELNRGVKGLLGWMKKNKNTVL
jgi:nucleoside-diphosphate-sugar epimerase